MALNLLTSVRTTDGIVKTGMGHYWGCSLVGDGTNPGTVVVYDGTDTGGTVIDTIKCVATGNGGGQYARPVKVKTGIYVDVTTPGSVTTWYR
jgi:hypothetical protein